jgi:hypothetical protein
MIKLLAAAAMLSGQGASPPPSRCVARQQVADLVVVIAPYFIDGARTRCAAHLPVSSYLRQPAAAQFAERMRAEGAPRRASALAAMGIISGEEMPGMGETALIAMMGETIAGMAMGAPAPQVCRDVSAVLEGMGAMSPDQAGRFMAAVMGLSSSARGATMNPRVCDEAA